MKGYQTKQQSTGEQFSKKEVSSFNLAKMLDCRQFNQMKPIQRKPDSKCDDSSRETSTSDDSLDELKLNYYESLHGKASTNDEHSDDKEQRSECECDNSSRAVSTSDEHSNEKKQKPHKIGSFLFDPVLESMIKDGTLKTSNQVFDEGREFMDIRKKLPPAEDRTPFIEEEFQRLEEDYELDLNNARQTNEVDFVFASEGNVNQSKYIPGNIIRRLLKTMDTCEYFWKIDNDTKREIINGYMSGYLTKAEQAEIERLKLELKDTEEEVQAIVSGWDNLTAEARVRKTDEAEDLNDKLLAKRMQIEKSVEKIDQAHKKVNETGKIAQKEAYFKVLKGAMQDIGGYICQLNMADYLSVFGIKAWVENKLGFLQDIGQFLEVNPELLDLSKIEDQQFLLMYFLNDYFRFIWVTVPAYDQCPELDEVGEFVESLLVDFSYWMQGLKHLGINVPQLTDKQQADYNQSRLSRAKAYREQHGTPEDKKILESNADIIREGTDNRDLSTMAKDVQERLVRGWKSNDINDTFITELYNIAAIAQENRIVNDAENIRTRVSKLIYSKSSRDMISSHKADAKLFREFLMKFFLQLPI